MSDIAKLIEGLQSFIDEKDQGHYFLTPAEVQDVLNIIRIAQERDALQTNIANLLKIIGTPALCSACGAEIWFVVNPKTNKRMPITKAGLNHFADCSNAKQFRKVRTT